MPKADITWTPASQKRFNSLLHEMQQATRKEMPKVVKATASDFSFQALKYTPIAPKWDAKRKTIPKGRGFAKQGWVWVLRSLGKSPRANYSGGRNKAKYLFHVTDRTKVSDPWIEVSNEVPYINDLDRGSATNPPYHIMAKSMNATMQLMERRLTKMAEKQSRKWRSVKVI